MNPAILALEDGTVFEGRSFGAPTERSGEVVFNTALTGYQEVFTDPSYSGQIVKWDDALHKGIDLSPKTYDFAATPPVLADAKGFYPAAVPGKTQVITA